MVGLALPLLAFLGSMDKGRQEGFVPVPKVRARDSVDWVNVGEDKGGMRYSRLSQINRESVKNLRVAWVYHTNDGDTRSKGASFGGPGGLGNDYRVPRRSSLAA